MSSKPLSQAAVDPRHPSEEEMRSIENDPQLLKKAETIKLICHNRGDTPYQSPHDEVFVFVVGKVEEDEDPIRNRFMIFPLDMYDTKEALLKSIRDEIQRKDVTYSLCWRGKLKKVIDTGNVNVPLPWEQEHKDDELRKISKADMRRFDSPFCFQYIVCERFEYGLFVRFTSHYIPENDISRFRKVFVDHFKEKIKQNTHKEIIEILREKGLKENEYQQFLGQDFSSKPTEIASNKIVKEVTENYKKWLEIKENTFTTLEKNEGAKYVKKEKSYMVWFRADFNDDDPSKTAEDLKKRGDELYSIAVRNSKYYKGLRTGSK